MTRSERETGRGTAARRTTKVPIGWIVIPGLAVLLAPLGASPALASSRSPRVAALAALDAGRAAEALALFDSLAALDRADGVTAYWAARACELAGRSDLARCRYLAVEAAHPRGPAGALAGWRRRAIERSAADAAAARGPDAIQRASGEAPGNAVLILPPEDLGGAGDTSLFGLPLVYLLQDALRGSGICPVPVSTMLVAADLLRYGRPVRAPAAISALPVNTLEGLRARLAVLPGTDGAVYLEAGGAGADGSDLAVESALIRFQRERALPPTGQADLPTQARLEEAMEAWLDQPPPSIDPRLVTRAAELVGATSVVRGTYRREAGRIVLELVPLDAGGTPRYGEPIVRDFAPAALVAAASEAATALSARIGGGSTPVTPSWSVPPEELERASRALLLLDRGLLRGAETRLRRAPEVWRAWPAIEAAQASLARSTDDANRTESELRLAWSRGSGADPRAALDALLDDLGWPAAAPDHPLESGVHDVIGAEGILIVHGEAE